MNLRFLLVLTPLVLLFSGCVKHNEQIPAYVVVQPFAVDALGGTAAQKIPDVWIYVNGEFLGTFTLPATIPVLAEGKTDLWIFPGIKENGQIETPKIYDFLTQYNVTVNLTPGQKTTVQPTSKYKTEAIFAWIPIERTTFDNSAVLILEDRDADPATSFILTTDGAFGGTGKSIKVAVDTAHPVIAFATDQAKDIYSTGDKQVWMEINYKNDMPFTLSLIGQSSSSDPEQYTSVFQFNNSDSWNKTYINLTELIVQANLGNYRLFFQVQLPQNINGQYSQNTGTVYLDNIRLIHF
jgi:hypothetical protein